MSRPILLVALVLLCSVPACEAKRGGPPAGGGGAPVEAASCPECSGLRMCPRCGESRPCLLCVGDGRCVFCDGGGEAGAAACGGCSGTGRCASCAPDAEAGLVAGQCRLCPHATGLCPECGGAGGLATGKPCALCRGEGSCPDCGGTGLDSFCGGAGICACCAGHGTAAPGAGPAPVALLLRDGLRIEGIVIGRPGLSIELEVAGDRRFVPAADVAPASLFQARRIRGDVGDPADLADLARLGMDAGGELLYFARAVLRASPLAEDPRIARDRRDLDLKAESLLSRMAADAADPARRRRLFLILANAFPDSPGAADYRARAERAFEVALRADRDLPEPVRRRKVAAESARAGRMLGRAARARKRAEALLASADVAAPALLRAREAARTGALLAASAAAGAPDADPAPFLAERDLAREQEAGALLRLARLLEASGRSARALEVAERAHSIAPPSKQEDR